MKSTAMLPQISSPFSATSAKPYSTPKVPTTFSLAMRPVKVATAGFQLPKPKGAKRGATAWPMEASRLVLLSSTMPNCPSVKPKPCRNHSTMEEARMTVPARLMKLQPRSQVARSTFAAWGTW